MIGSFFTRADKKPKASSLRTMPVDYLRRVGPDAVRKMNPNAVSWNIQPIGTKNPDVYVLHESPSIEDDEAGRPCSGTGGRRLKAKLVSRVDARYGFLCGTRPPDGRIPTSTELEAFRGVVEEDLLRTKPKVVLLLGRAAVAWMGLSGTMTPVRGRKFAHRVGDHCFWVVCSFDSDWVAGLDKGMIDDVPVDQLKEAWKRDVEMAIDAVNEKPPTVEVYSKERIAKLIKCPTDFDECMQALDRLDRSKLIGWDYETEGIRPYPEATQIKRVLSYALSDGTWNVAVPVMHPDAGFSSKQVAKLKAKHREIVTASHGVVAHNLPFELEWYVFDHGAAAAREATWGCSLASAYILDQRQGGLSLDFQCRQHFGVPLKSLSNINVKKLASTPLDRVLLYNGLDAFFCRKLSLHHNKLLTKSGQTMTYKEQVRRVPTAVVMQHRGMPVDQERVAELDEFYRKNEDKALAKFEKTKEVRGYRKRYGQLNPKSTTDLVRLYRDFLGDDAGALAKGKRRKGRKTDGGYSVDDDTMKVLEESYSSAKHLRRFRRASKLRGTYVLPYKLNHPGGFVYQDGLIHCDFNTTKTNSRRWSSEQPNLQNWPKRKDSSVRSQFVAPDGWTWLSIDFGQIEARVLAMHSKDRRFCAALWEDQDVHMEWAERISDVFPDVLEISEGSVEKFRSYVKNLWVFPLFYGSSVGGVARNLKLPDDVAYKLVDEFWRYFSGIKKWQDKVLAFYDKNFYVESFSGFRRWGPLSKNQIINNAIQGDAADITTDALNRIGERAYAEGVPYLHPLIQIHDDIIFLVLVKYLEQCIEFAVEEMLNCPFSFVNVPLTCAPAHGLDLQNLIEVGNRSSKDL